jgi:hypothetical protein
MTYYIEDILHLLVDTIGVEESDHSILRSISLQCKKNVALTDRQYDLVANKIQNYKAQLQDHNCLLEDNLPTRLPLRDIDRSKTISIVDHGKMLGPDSAYESYKDKWQWVKVRFPFSKKLISKLDVVKGTINQSSAYYHVKGSNEHYFRLNGNTVVKLIDMFKNCSFTIDDSLIDYYQKSQEILNNVDRYIPQHDNDKFCNLASSLVEQLPELNEELIVVDRRIRYGYKTNSVKKDNTLSEQIAYRVSQNFNVDPQHYSLADIASAVRQLNRFPMIVQIDNGDSFEQLSAFHNAFSFVDNNFQSVLFRADSDDGQNSKLNSYIKDNNLNNWVDNNTKIVYIKKNQLPKVLLNSDFIPTTSISSTSHRSNQQVDLYCKFYCDLIIHHDKESSMFNTKFGSYLYAHM